MMFPACRIGDPVSHDLLVPAGAVAPNPAAPFPTVFIEGLPAAAVGCACPCSGLSAAGPAHPPPPGPPPAIASGSLTVSIGGLPAARWAPAPDLSACGAMLGDPKLAGMRTVMIGG